MEFISSDKAPKAVGPYSQAILVDGFMFLSGQIPLDPATGQIAAGDIEVQTHQVFKNIRAVLAEKQMTLYHVLKTTVFMKDLADYKKMNAVYDQQFSGHKPARSTVQVAALPLGSLIEIECIAKI
ncbi:MAG: RidA family protein [Candidatus Omnitrophica bacterium]|nr:RidA family protein [Candidatus Omnitrophota bacterium]